MKKYDIYISYEKNDNHPLFDSNKGWVTYFQTFLELVLEQILNSKPSFLFFSNKENPSSQQIENVEILICILSPYFINSKNCIEDIDAFLSAKDTDGKFDKAIFKVIKNPVPIEQQPSYLQGLRNFDLYKRNLETGGFDEILDFFAPEAEKTFWVKLIDLAYDIANELNDRKGETYKFSLKKPKTKSTVYLAQTGYDYLNERNYIKRELLKHGYEVLPNHPFPTNVRELEVFIRKNMEMSNLSVHLIGHKAIPNAHSLIPDLESKIAEEYGNYILAESEYKGNDKNFKRIIWISPEKNKADDQQKSFIENLIHDAESLEGVEILQTPLEDLKSIIKKEILTTSIRKKIFRNYSSKNKLYLVYDKIDLDQGKLLVNFLEQQGFEVLKPTFDGELLEIRQQHIENLKNCDAAIIHYGNVNEQWVQMKFLDLLKCPGFGRSKPLLAKAIFAEESSKINYSFYEDYDIDILTGEFYESFQSFLAKIDQINHE